MTVNSQAASSPLYLGNGSATAFPFLFSAGSAEEIRVFVDGVADSLPYSVVLEADHEGGTVNFDTAPSVGRQIIISSNPSFAQDISFINGGPFNAESHEEANDQAARRDLYLRARHGETLRAPEGEAVAALPPPADREGTVVGFSLFTGIREILTYANLSTLLAPFLTPLLSAINKGDPGGNVMSVGLFLAGSSISVSTGTNIVRTSGYSVDGRGGALYQYDVAVDAAYVTAHPRAAFVSGNGRGFRLSLDQQLTVYMFGAVGDDTANDGAAFVAALAFCFANSLAGTSIGGKGCPSLKGPRGKFYLGAQPLDITHTIDFFGEGGATFGAASQLRWDDMATAAVRFQGNDTTGDTTTGAQTYPGSYGSLFRGFYLKGGYAGTESEGHGILMRARAHLEDLTIDNFSGDGLAVIAGADAHGGNANGWNANRVFSYRNRDGFRVDGADANIGAGRGIITTWNRRWGVNDSSFLGSLWDGQSEVNGRVSLGSVPTLTVYNGHWYAVIAGQEAGASTHAPSGTLADNTWWYYSNEGGSNPGAPDWVSGLTFRAGGSARTDSPSAPTVFLNWWSEYGQGPMQLVVPTQVSGGNQPSGLRGISVIRQTNFGMDTEHLRASKTLNVGPTDGAEAAANGTAIFEHKLTNFIMTFRRWISPGVAVNDALIQADAQGLSLTGNPGIPIYANGVAVGTFTTNGLELLAGKVLKIAGIQVVGPQFHAINDAANAVGVVTLTDFNNLVAIVNLILAERRAAGGVAP